MSLQGIVTEYFEWEDLPCRLMQDAGGVLSAEIYVPGVGFKPISTTTVMMQGYKISERRFKQLVVELAGFAGRQGAS